MRCLSLSFVFVWLVFFGPAVVTAYAFERIERLSPALRADLAPGGEQRVALYASLEDRLRQARDAAHSEQIHTALNAVLRWTGSDTARTMIVWAEKDREKERFGAALDTLDALVVAMPDLAEAYVQRAHIHHEMKDYGRALADLAQAYRLEPYRHDVMLGMAATSKALGAVRPAYQLYRYLLARDPRNEALAGEVARLRPQVEGVEH